MKKYKNIIWFIICLALTYFCISKVNNIFKLNNDIAYEAQEGLYKERPGSMDAVYIGSSNAYYFWQPPFAWADHGIAVWSYSISLLPVQAVPYIMKEVRKTQPNALFIVNTNLFVETNVSSVSVHRTTDYFHFSLDKLKLIDRLANDAGYKGWNKLQFYLPLTLFHSRWSSLDSWDYLKTQHFYKKGYNSGLYLRGSVDQTEQMVFTEKEARLTEEQNKYLDELLSYIDENDVNVLFVTVPQGWGESITPYGHMNTVERIIREHGYDCLDLLHDIDRVGVQIKKDFVHRKHTNIHGANKFTEYVSQYLIDKYGFTDKRGLPGWESWDEAAEAYLDLSGYYLIPIERSHELRDYSIPAPANLMAAAEGQTITVTWEASKGAQNYDIFRRSTDPNEKNWAYYDTTTPGALEYIDRDLQADVKYSYIVVPRYESNGKVFYGDFDYNGAAAKTDPLPEYQEGIS